MRNFRSSVFGARLCKGDAFRFASSVGVTDGTAGKAAAAADSSVTWEVESDQIHHTRREGHCAYSDRLRRGRGRALVHASCL